ncbi:hypothetical protein DXG01_008530 [Tephrocybe rancida]|nr:hypothetical protein DXG01_008530 [Tephrocybe rancida]
MAHAPGRDSALGHGSIPDHLDAPIFVKLAKVLHMALQIPNNSLLCPSLTRPLTQKRRGGMHTPLQPPPTGLPTPNFMKHALRVDGGRLVRSIAPIRVLELCMSLGGLGWVASKLATPQRAPKSSQLLLSLPLPSSSQTTPIHVPVLRPPLDQNRDGRGRN